MCCLGKGINVILNDKGAILKEQKENLLCKSAKLLADLSQHLRRILIMPQMNNSVREMAETILTGIYLFRDDFGNKVTDLKTMEKTSKGLKPIYI